jgi:hypothetical protein
VTHGIEHARPARYKTAVLAVVIALTSSVLGADGVDHAEPAYRVGTATNRVAILPVRCERDLDPALCAALGESIAVEIGKEPRLDVVNPRDIDVLLGAQTVADLSTCEHDDCFAHADFTRIDASYLLALAVNRIGDDAKLVVRVVDLKRGAVIDRDEASAPRHDERQIEKAAKSLVMTVLVRRGLARPPDDVREDHPLGAAFWVGTAAGVVGLAAAGGGAYLGIQAFTATGAVNDAAAAGALSRADFDKQAASARASALGSDVLVGAGALCLVGGGILMIAGAL